MHLAYRGVAIVGEWSLPSLVGSVAPMEVLHARTHLAIRKRSLSCRARPDHLDGFEFSATDAVADVGGLRRVDHPNDLQLDPRRQDVEQPTATTEQHRDLMDLQLI